MNQTVPPPTHAGRLKVFLSGIVPTDVQRQEKWKKVRFKVRLKVRLVGEGEVEGEGKKSSRCKGGK